MKVTFTGTTSIENALEQFALPCTREKRISLVKMLFATRQNLQTNPKDALDPLSHVQQPHWLR